MKYHMYKALSVVAAVSALASTAFSFEGNMSPVEAEVSEIVADTCPKELTKDQVAALQQQGAKLTMKNHNWEAKKGMSDYAKILADWKGNIPLRTGSSGLPHEGASQPTDVHCYYSYRPFNLGDVVSKGVANHVVTIQTTVETKK